LTSLRMATITHPSGLGCSPFWTIFCGPKKLSGETVSQGNKGRLQTALGPDLGEKAIEVMPYSVKSSNDPSVSSVPNRPQVDIATDYRILSAHNRAVAALARPGQASKAQGAGWCGVNEDHA
jgi:hypothetical protein